MILAVTAARIFKRVVDFPAPIGIPVALGSPPFSTVIGLLFGHHSAFPASRLSPFEALRSE